MNRLKFYREKNKLTQVALAAKLQVSFQAIHKWESGEAYPSADKLPTLADALGCTIDELFGRTTKEESTHETS